MPEEVNRKWSARTAQLSTPHTNLERHNTPRYRQTDRRSCQESILLRFGFSLSVVAERYSSYSKNA